MQRRPLTKCRFSTRNYRRETIVHNRWKNITRGTRLLFDFWDILTSEAKKRGFDDVVDACHLWLLGQGSKTIPLLAI